MFPTRAARLLLLTTVLVCALPIPASAQSSDALSWRDRFHELVAAVNKVAEESGRPAGDGASRSTADEWELWMAAQRHSGYLEGIHRNARDDQRTIDSEGVPDQTRQIALGWLANGSGVEEARGWAELVGANPLATPEQKARAEEVVEEVDLATTRARLASYRQRLEEAAGLQEAADLGPKGPATEQPPADADASTTGGQEPADPQTSGTTDDDNHGEGNQASLTFTAGDTAEGAEGGRSGDTRGTEERDGAKQAGRQVQQPGGQAQGFGTTWQDEAAAVTGQPDADDGQAQRQRPGGLVTTGGGLPGQPPTTTDDTGTSGTGDTTTILGASIPTSLPGFQTYSSPLPGTGTGILPGGPARPSLGPLQDIFVQEPLAPVTEQVTIPDFLLQQQQEVFGAPDPLPTGTGTDIGIDVGLVGIGAGSGTQTIFTPPSTDLPGLPGLPGWNSTAG